jgi:tetratricopeptide (TPR) repeat protein
MEAPGRPAVTWRSEDTGKAPAPETGTDSATERQLLAELQGSEEKGSSQLALATTIYNLAILRRQQGSLAEAERLYRKALAIREQEQGPAQPEVAVILNNLAALEVAEGRYTDAQALLERALTIRQATLGNTDPLTAESLSNLALLYAAQGDAAAAEPLYKQALAILAQEPPVEDHAQTPEARQTEAPRGDAQRSQFERVVENYAALLRDTGRETEADAVETHARARHTGASAPIP